MIQSGAKLDAVDEDGNTPIHAAMFFAASPYSKESSGVLMLIKCGASLKIRNKDGSTLLECALKGNLFNSKVKMPNLKVLLYNEKMWILNSHECSSYKITEIHQYELVDDFFLLPFPEI